MYFTQRKSLTENGETVTEDKKVTEILSEYIAYITPDLEIPENETFFTPTIGKNDSMDKTIEMV